MNDAEREAMREGFQTAVDQLGITELVAIVKEFSKLSVAGAMHADALFALRQRAREWLATYEVASR